jgi:hypothetical protein
MTLFDNRSPRIVVLRRKGRAFADAGGACRSVIGCAFAGPLGIATGCVRTGCRGSGGVSGGASTDHPSGMPGITVRSMPRVGPPTARGGCRLRLQSAPVSERLAPDESRGFGLAGIGVLAFPAGMNGPADCGACGLVLARHGSRLHRRASAAQHGAHSVVAEPLLQQRPRTAPARRRSSCPRSYRATAPPGLSHPSPLLVRSRQSAPAR